MTYAPHTIWIGGPPVVIEVHRPRKPSPKRPCTKERNAFILARRATGEKFASIALQVGLSQAWCQEIYLKSTRKVSV